MWVLLQNIPRPETTHDITTRDKTSQSITFRARDVLCHYFTVFVRPVHVYKITVFHKVQLLLRPRPMIFHVLQDLNACAVH